jgi:hypothetical protein
VKFNIESGSIFVADVKLVAHIEFVLLGVEQIPHEEGVGMSFQREVVASMLIHEVVKVADVESVEFDCLVDSSVYCFSVILRIAVH